MPEIREPSWLTWPGRSPWWFGGDVCQLRLPESGGQIVRGQQGIDCLAPRTDGAVPRVCQEHGDGLAVAGDGRRHVVDGTASVSGLPQKVVQAGAHHRMASRVRVRGPDSVDLGRKLVRCGRPGLRSRPPVGALQRTVGLVEEEHRRAQRMQVIHLSLGAPRLADGSGQSGDRLLVGGERGARAVELLQDCCLYLRHIARSSLTSPCLSAAPTPSRGLGRYSGCNGREVPRPQPDEYTCRSSVLASRGEAVACGFSRCLTVCLAGQSHARARFLGLIGGILWSRFGRCRAGPLCEGLGVSRVGCQLKMTERSRRLLPSLWPGAIVR